jgi:hypothetical protein
MSRTFSRRVGQGACKQVGTVLLLRIGTPKAGQALCTRRSSKRYIEDLLEILAKYAVRRVST